MSNFERVFNKGEELHPMVNGEFFTMPVSIEMEGVAKKYFDIANINEFIIKIKNDNSFRSIVIDTINSNYNTVNRKIITSKDGELWFFIDYKKYNKPYTLFYAKQLADLNKSLFFENYIDLLGNKIEFEVYS